MDSVNALLGLISGLTGLAFVRGGGDIAVGPGMGTIHLPGACQGRSFLVVPLPS